QLNGTRADYGVERCPRELFVERVAASPAKTAVECEGRALSYRELYETSCDLALYLQSKGVGPDRMVVVLMERSVDMMVAIMGTALAGGAYLPLDPDYPDERLAYVLRDSEAAVLITDGAFEERVASLWGAGGELISLDRQWPDIREYAAAAKGRNVELRREVE